MSFFLSSMSWIALSFAIVFGVLGTLSMKASSGFKYLKPVIFIAIFYVMSFVALTYAMQKIELSIVYAIWSGVGTVLVTTIGILYFKESASFRKFVYLLLIVMGVIGIHISDYFS